MSQLDDMNTVADTYTPFDGETYDPPIDSSRLTSQLARVTALMSDGMWRTLHEISVSVFSSEAGVSARLRDLRKSKFGGHTVDKRRRGLVDRGLFEYRLVIKL